MRLKRAVITALIAINLFLLGILATMSTSLQPAYAQRSGSGGGKYLAVTAEYTVGTDALFLLHTGKGILTALIPSQTNAAMQVTDSRDLSQDFGAR